MSFLSKCSSLAADSQSGTAVIVSMRACRYEWVGDAVDDVDDADDVVDGYRRISDSFATAQYHYSTSEYDFPSGWYCVWCGSPVPSGATDNGGANDEGYVDAAQAGNSEVPQEAQLPESTADKAADPYRYCGCCSCALVYPGEVRIGDDADGTLETPSEDAAAPFDAALVDDENVGQWARSVRDQVLMMKFQAPDSSTPRRTLLRRGSSASTGSGSHDGSRPHTPAKVSGHTLAHTDSADSGSELGTDDRLQEQDQGGEETEAEWTEQELQEYWDWYYGTGAHAPENEYVVNIHTMLFRHVLTVTCLCLCGLRLRYDDYDVSYDFEVADNNDYSAYAQWFAEDAAAADGGEVCHSNYLAAYPRKLTCDVPLNRTLLMTPEVEEEAWTSIPVSRLTDPQKTLRTTPATTTMATMCVVVSRVVLRLELPITHLYVAG